MRRIMNNMNDNRDHIAGIPATRSATSDQPLQGASQRVLLIVVLVPERITCLLLLAVTVHNLLVYMVLIGKVGISLSLPIIDEVSAAKRRLCKKGSLQHHKRCCQL